MLTEIEFYDRLAEFFDVMTDWPSRLAVELPFIETTLARFDAHTILDCACGTGGHSVALAQHGYQVAGADISAAMLARAQANATRAELTIPFRVARFEDLPSVFPEQMDAVICLGNSLPHLLTDSAALASVSAMRACLRSGGALMVHQLNYDRRWREQPRWFAVNAGALAGRETLVWRFADYDDAARRITFNIALFTRNAQGAWTVDVQSTPQYPYQRAEIEMLLHRAGFRALEFFGNLQGDRFDAEHSADLVVVATV